MRDNPTLAQFLIDDLKEYPKHQELSEIIAEIAMVGKEISHHTNKAGLVEILGAASGQNTSGDQVQKLDVFANELCKKIFRESKHFAAMASEEEETAVDMGGENKEAKYIIAFDPLDGSSNIDVNVSIGTIFSIHEKLPEYKATDPRQFFQLGKDQVLAGYILYGSSTVLIFSYGNGKVHEFTLDPDTGDFFLSNEAIRVPEKCKYYSVNESYTQYFTSKDREFIAYLKKEKRCSARYIGSLVSDFHRNLIKGGIFLYPALDKEGTGTYKGKLRLIYELKPMAFLLDNAGGLASNGSENILDIKPNELHERAAIFMGNSDVVQKYLQF